MEDSFKKGMRDLSRGRGRRGRTTRKGSEVGKSPAREENWKEARVLEAQQAQGKTGGEEAGWPGRGRPSKACGPRQRDLDFQWAAALRARPQALGS